MASLIKSNSKQLIEILSFPKLDKFVGKGSESQPEFITTLPTLPPTHTKCKALSTTKVKCSWQKPDYMANGLKESYAYLTNITSISLKFSNSLI